MGECMFMFAWNGSWFQPGCALVSSTTSTRVVRAAARRRPPASAPPPAIRFRLLSSSPVSGVLVTNSLASYRGVRGMILLLLATSSQRASSFKLRLIRSLSRHLSCKERSWSQSLI